MATNSARHLAIEPKSRAARIAAAALAQAVEIDLVQQHRVGGDQLLALQPVEAEARSRRRIEGGEIPADRVQPAHRAAIVVLVVAGDQLGREALEAGRLEGDRTGLEGHGSVFL
jgi:hypothetical protein